MKTTKTNKQTLIEENLKILKGQHRMGYQIARDMYKFLTVKELKKLKEMNKAATMLIEEQLKEQNKNNFIKEIKENISCLMK